MWTVKGYWKINKVKTLIGHNLKDNVSRNDWGFPSPAGED